MSLRYPSAEGTIAKCIAAATKWIVFATFGLAAIVYSTILSFAGSTFPDRYGDGALRPTYCAAFQSCDGSWDSSKVDANVLRLLRDW